MVTKTAFLGFSEREGPRIDLITFSQKGSKEKQERSYGGKSSDEPLKISKFKFRIHRYPKKIEISLDHQNFNLKEKPS